MGCKLYSSRLELINLFFSDTKSAIPTLIDKYGFGKHSDFWDDHIFNTILSPALSRIAALDLKSAVNLYAYLDHELFLPYIRRDEDPGRFRRAFWNVNSFGMQISRRFNQYLLDSGKVKSQAPIHLANTNSKRRIAFAFKGPFCLAHAEFFKEFLIGCQYFRDEVEVFLILLDAKLDSPLLSTPKLKHVNVISLSDKRTGFEKLTSYAEVIHSLNLDHLSWIACVQNISLYMGSRFVNRQSYWSMKYHSIIMDSLDKYAGLGFGGGSFYFDDIHWFRGRAFPDLSLPAITIHERDAMRSSFNIPSNAFVAGCFVRSEKLNNLQYWELIHLLLERFPEMHFVIASQNLPAISDRFLKTNIFNERFHHLGWVDTKKWCQCIDIYIDSFPRGSCLTALEAIKASKPVIIFDSEHNRESSALPYLNSVKRTDSCSGIYSIQQASDLLKQLEQVVGDIEYRSAIVREQSLMLSKLEGQRHLFAKDYLNYFLDTSYSISLTAKI